jgi:hypothetical protein
MNQQKSHSRRPNTGMRGVKFMILSMGLTSVLGFWGLFSRQAAATGLVNPSSANNNTLFLQSSGSDKIVLPPVPTLSPRGAQRSFQAGAPLSSNQAPLSSFGFFSNGSNPGQSSQPLPFATTRSSR